MPKNMVDRERAGRLLAVRANTQRDKHDITLTIAMRPNISIGELIKIRRNIGCTNITPGALRGMLDYPTPYRCPQCGDICVVDADHEMWVCNKCLSRTQRHLGVPLMRAKSIQVENNDRQPVGWLVQRCPYCSLPHYHPDSREMDIMQCPSLKLEKTAYEISPVLLASRSPQTITVATAVKMTETRTRAKGSREQC